MQGTDAMRPLLGSAADPLHPSSITLLAGLKPSSPTLQRALWQDLMREDDARQMDALIAKLDSMRTQKPPELRPAKPLRKDQPGERRIILTCFGQPSRLITCARAHDFNSSQSTSTEHPSWSTTHVGKLERQEHEGLCMVMLILEPSKCHRLVLSSVPCWAKDLMSPLSLD